MTLTAQPEVVVAPAWQFFDASVAAVRRLGPSFVRLTLTGPELAGFGAAGCDQRFKLVLSRDDAGLARLRDRGQDWYPEYCAMPEEQRPVIRTYTVRAVRPERAELDVDVVLHGVEDGHAGPAASWAAAAVPGDRTTLLGPDRPGSGRPWGAEWAAPQAGPAAAGRRRARRARGLRDPGVPRRRAALADRGAGGARGRRRGGRRPAGRGDAALAAAGRRRPRVAAGAGRARGAVRARPRLDARRAAGGGRRRAAR